MFDETKAEAFYVEKIQEASAAATVEGQPGFLKVDTIGAYMIDEENVEEFVKIAPACLISIGDETVIDDEDALGTIQLADFVLTVNIVCKGAWKFKNTSDNVNALGRMTKKVLRGLTYGPSNGSTEKTAVTRFLDRTTFRIDGGLLIAVQRYAIRTLDTN